MRLLIMIGAVIGATLAVSCSTTYMTYRSDLFEGRELLEREHYAEARERFLKASGEERRAAPFAYAATASYKMNDTAAAERYLAEAENAEGRSYWYLRIAGYKALTLLKENKGEKGMEALKRYLDYYRLTYPLMSIDKVDAMWQTGRINLKELEALLDEQITTYEQEVSQAVTTGTGYYATRPSPGGVATSPSPD